MRDAGVLELLACHLVAESLVEADDRNLSVQDERLGYEVTGEKFEDAGIPHREMRKSL